MAMTSQGEGRPAPSARRSGDPVPRHAPAVLEGVDVDRALDQSGVVAERGEEGDALGSRAPDDRAAAGVGHLADRGRASVATTSA